MGAQREHPPAHGRDRPAGIERAEPAQQVARRGHRPRRRRIHEAQRLAAPGRQLQRQARQLDLRDLRPALRLQPLRLRPQPVRPARRHAPRAPRALVGRGLRDPNHVEPAEAAVGIVPRLARQPAVDDHAHPGQGHAGLGHVGRQHHPSPAIGRRLQHARLLLHRQVAVQRQHLDAGHRGPGRRGIAPGILQHPRQALDLAPSRQEHQHVARMRRQRMLDRPPRLVLDRLVATRREMRHLDRKAPPRARQPRRLQERRQPLAVQRRRHHHDAQVLAQPRLHVQRQRQPQVGREMALVELVEQQRPDPVQHRIVLQHAREDALGDDLHPRRRRYPALEADPVADRLPDLLAQRRRHEPRRRPRRHPPRLQHHDPPPLEPRRIQQRQRHPRGLARPRRRLQYQPRMRRERGPDLRQQSINGKRRLAHPQRIGPPARKAATEPRHGGSNSPVRDTATDSPPSPKPSNPYVAEARRCAGGMDSAQGRAR